MNQIPGTKTSTKTSTVNGVTTTVTTITAPGQPTRVTTTTSTKRPVQVPVESKQPAQPAEPQQQPRPQPVQQKLAPSPEPPKKSGFFSKLKNHLRNDDPPKPKPKRNSVVEPVPVPVPTPTPKPQQKPLPQQPQPQPHHEKVTVIRHEGDGPMDKLAEKMQQASINRPHVEHHTHTTTTPDGKVTTHHHTTTTTSSGGDLDDAIARLKYVSLFFTRFFFLLFNLLPMHSYKTHRRTQGLQQLGDPMERTTKTLPSGLFGRRHGVFE